MLLKIYDACPRVIEDGVSVLYGIKINVYPLQIAIKERKKYVFQYNSVSPL